MNQTNAAPAGKWVHSFEEDAGDVLVFRPSQSFSFPASRRFRETLEFQGSTVINGMPGADDRTRYEAMDTGSLDQNLVRLDAGEHAGQVYEIVEVTGDRLTLRPQ